MNVMANRSNRRWVSLSRAMAFEVAIPIRPRRADAHHGQEAMSSTNRSDIRAQSHLDARDVIRSCYPRVVALIPIPDAKTGGPIHPRPECNALSTAARPPASVRGALPGDRPWITLQLTPIQPPPTLKTPRPALAYREESIYALRVLVGTMRCQAKDAPIQQHAARFRAATGRCTRCWPYRCHYWR